MKGFTLIELMIVIVIIGVLAGIALIQYRNFIIKSQITSAVIELMGSRTQYELIMNDGANNNDFTNDNIGFSVSEICTYVVHKPIGEISQPALECQLKNVASAIQGESIYLNRTAGGSWKCSTSVGIANKFKPVDCI
ncbi:prepilin-type cleavage/methylation domain-containing protein [Acinetobacter sp. ANC 4648]|nr:prepilin-type cleavage/methylation domain-containing protein [Acinetobacter sp. ANC 4648]